MARWCHKTWKHVLLHPNVFLTLLYFLKNLSSALVSATSLVSAGDAKTLGCTQPTPTPTPTAATTNHG